MSNNEYLNLLTNYAKASGAFAYVMKRFYDGNGISKKEVMAEYDKLKVAYKSLEVLKSQYPTDKRLNEIMTIASADFNKANSDIQNL